MKRKNPKTIATKKPEGLLALHADLNLMTLTNKLGELRVLEQKIRQKEAQ